MPHTIASLKKSCGGCTECCKGWLTAEIFGYKIGPGRPCQFLGKKGCNVYDLRPYDPCAAWTCFWKDNIGFPEWMRPDLSHAIIIRGYLENYHFLEVIITKPELDERVLNFLKDLAKGPPAKHVILIYSVKDFYILSEDNDFKNLYLKTKTNFKGHLW